MPKKSKKKTGRKAKSDWQKAHEHSESIAGRRVASKYQQKNTPYVPRVTRSVSKTGDVSTHVSVMTGLKYGKRTGRDDQGRSYSSTYRGKKAGYLGDIRMGEY